MDEEILYVDDDIIAINKPVGLSVHAAWPDLIPIDVVGILKAQLGLDYLGIHQRLDRETSGVMVFARRPAANAWLATAFEDRAAIKDYLAIVHGVPKPAVGRIDAPLREGKSGRMLVAARSPTPSAGLIPAVTEYELLQISPDRRLSLVRVRLLTGRTHQARVHLASLGTPVVGDPLYDPEQRFFPRLLLHAHRLTLPTPTGPLTLEAPAPEVFGRFFGNDKPFDNSKQRLPSEAAFRPSSTPKSRQLPRQNHSPNALELGRGEVLRQYLALAAERRRPLARDPLTTTYRLVNGAADGLPQVYVDRFGDNLLVSLHSDDLGLPEGLGDSLHDLHQPAAMFVRYRPRQASRLSEAEVGQRAPSQPIRGESAAEWEVQEDGRRYLIRSDAGLSVGLFLDMRETRARVRVLARGRTVLNLFAYTCAFGVAAVAGGASRVLNLDISRRWLDWGMENYRRNGYAPDSYDFVDGDVFDWLRRFARRRQTFDLVILDPPSFATTRASRFIAERDWPALARAAAQVVSPGGALLACSNHAGLARPAFREQVQAGASQASPAWTEEGYWAEPALDFPTLPDQPGYLKLLLLRRTS